MSGLWKTQVRSLLVSLFFALPVASGTRASAQTESHLSARIQQSAAFYRNHDGFMGVVAIQRKHQLIYESGYGYANVAAKTPFTPHTRFPIGSLSKQFTAAAILLLQQDGRLKTSDSIKHYYPKAPDSWNGVTLRNLLTQTSGLPDFDFGEVYRNTHHRPQEFVEDILNKPLAFRRGAKFEYSNANYLLLGLVVERASGHSLCDFLRNRIFRPLQLKQTGCSWNDHVPGSAQGYHPSNQGPVPFEDPDLNSIAGAGSLYSTADDLIRWTEALHGGRVLSKVSLIEMLTPFLSGYAYGLGIDGEGADLDISHNGTVEGFFSCLDYLPATHTTVVVLSNLVAEGNGSTPGTVALDTELVRLGVDPNAVVPSDRRDAQVVEEVLRSYAGRYRSDDSDRPVEITLTFRDDRLYIRNDSRIVLPLHAESATRFYIATQETEIIFDAHTAGRFEFVNYAPFGGAVFNRLSETQSGDNPAAPPPQAKPD